MIDKSIAFEGDKSIQIACLFMNFQFPFGKIKIHENTMVLNSKHRPTVQSLQRTLCEAVFNRLNQLKPLFSI